MEVPPQVSIYGNSVVDYGITGENLLPLCSYFMVSPNSISDHADHSDASGNIE